MRIAALFTHATSQSLALRGFESAGLPVHCFSDMTQLCSAARAQGFDAVVLEAVPDRVAGWVSEFRQRVGAGTPVIVHGFDNSSDIACALRHGADDCCSLLEGPSALLLRVEVRVGLARRKARENRLEAGPFALDATTQCLQRPGLQISLTAREFALAWALFENAGKVVTLHSLSAEIWGRNSDIGKRTIEQHVYKLRRKITAHAEGMTVRMPTIQAIYGVGYRLHL